MTEKGVTFSFRVPRGSYRILATGRGSPASRQTSRWRADLAQQVLSRATRGRGDHLLDELPRRRLRRSVRPPAEQADGSSAANLGRRGFAGFARRAKLVTGPSNVTLGGASMEAWAPHRSHERRLRPRVLLPLGRSAGRRIHARARAWPPQSGSGSSTSTAPLHRSPDEANSRRKTLDRQAAGDLKQEVEQIV